ncbi:hypothetical protein [Chryseobacterium tongliaoense]|uniref:hypothetical protein n=1 Tax=Chryseobacterium tongliaoense TaxID=3240933 RepID=UPI00351228D4
MVLSFLLASLQLLKTQKTPGSTVGSVSNVDGVLIQNAATENTSAKTTIGTLASTPGILVLENKAMILPKMPSPHLNIINHHRE